MRHILRWALSLTAPIVLTMALVRLLTLPWYPALEYRRPGFPEDLYGMSRDARLRLAQASIRFLNVPAGRVDLAALQLPDGTPAYNDQELSHMDDVKRVYNALTLAAGVALVVAVAAGWGLVRLGGRCELWLALTTSGVVTLAALGGLGVWMILGFEQFFTRFHGLFFDPGTWVFYQSDTLIRLFPMPFWRDAGLLIAIGVSLLALALIRVGVRGTQRCAP